MKNWQKKPLAVAYLAALVVWILMVLVCGLQAAWHTVRGSAGNGEVSLQQLQLTALVEQKPNAEIPEGDWLVSSDSDPQIRWNCGGKYIDVVELDMQTLWPTGAVVIYYRTVGQPDFSPDRILYAQITEDGKYRFDLGGKVVEEIRIDPASSGGVILKIEGLQLHAWELSNLVPNFGQLVLLLGLPVVAAAAWNICSSAFGSPKSSKE